MFDDRLIKGEPGDILFEDRFREVELGLAFRRAVCYRCGFIGIYRYQVQQIRRNAEIAIEADEETRADHEEIWKGVPRYAEIPQTVKCKRCQEVIGICTSCIF